MSFVLISPKDGDCYHRIGDSGFAACGCLNRKQYRRRDTGAIVCKADTVETVAQDVAELRGYRQCGSCWRQGGESDE